MGWYWIGCRLRRNFYYYFWRMKRKCTVLAKWSSKALLVSSEMAFKCFDHWTVRFCFTLLHFSRTIHIETSKSFPPKWKSFKTQPTFLFTYFILFVFYISSSTTPFTPHNKFNSHKWLFIHCLVLLSLLLYFIFYERICFLYKYKDRIHNSIMSD